MILTNLQEKFLDYVSNHNFADKIYWTGGTALAYRYNHRLSTDLVFFSKDFLADFEILPFINDIKKTFGSDKVIKQTVYNRNIFIFDENMDNLKIELTFFPFENIYNYDNWKDGLRIDSIMDIATNKIHAISERFEVKDIYDIYFILNRENVSIKDLIKNVDKKFGVELNYNDIIARLNYIGKDVDKIKPFLIGDIDLEKIKGYFESMI